MPSVSKHMRHSDFIFSFIFNLLLVNKIMTSGVESRCYDGLDLLEPKANYNRRVIGRCIARFPFDSSALVVLQTVDSERVNVIVCIPITASMYCIPITNKSA